FANDVVTVNGQPFIFSPRPPRPPILIGGHGEHTWKRVVNHGDGWMPMGADPAKIEAPLAQLRRRLEQAGKPPPQVVPMAKLELDDAERATAQLARGAELGVTGVNHAARVDSVAALEDEAARLLEVARRAGV